VIRNTEKQKRFIKEYIIDYNATKAAQRAGYSKKTAYSIGQELLKKPEIQEKLQKQLDKINKKTEASAEEAIRMCRDIAIIDHSDYQDKRTSRGIELYGRTQSVFVDRKVVEGGLDLGVSDELSDLISDIVGEK